MPTLTGLDVLLQDKLSLLKNKRVALITNPTGVTRELRSNIDALRAAGANLVALYSPEHGIAASAGAGENVESGIDARTGLPVYSLYGNIRKPTAEMLVNVDALLFDLQDVGARFYTYTATLGLALEACAENRVPLIVLDRPNPINGATIEGPVLDPALQTFVGYGAIPVRYALTLGELAQFYNQTSRAELRVVEMRGWTRGMWYDETKLSFVPPSPNMPHLSTAIVYPGMCLLEGTNFSVGRGTALPFEMIGAPFVDGYALAEELNARKIDGARFRPAAFTPSANKFANENCFGAQIHVTDRDALRPVTMALEIIAALKRIYPAQFEWNARGFDRLMGDARVRGWIDRGEKISVSQWTVGYNEFRKKRAACLLY
ncbi:MAG: DUF1343 domain-containing protein [Chloroflexi bacterium]|nr:DUF1343 domain-containing protein [Chloroflexota bacterium]